MSALGDFWNRSSRGAKLGLAGGVVVVVGLSIALGLWALRTPYDVLFSQLTQGDAASIVEQLKRQKTPYELADGGATIKVPATAVHETRLGLMSSGVPLAGGVGFELFDKQGLGATEQSQRVSYQRALQGELARTIGALDNVQQARVHLVLPESTLFKRDRQEARAAVNLIVKPGTALDGEQIAGIQRLVAASVAGLEFGKVVISDQRGVTLSMADATDGPGGGEARLAMKREIEEYITRKVAQLLDMTYGPGQAIVSCDVQLNFDEVTRTVRDILPVSSGAANSGVRRRRQVVTAANGAGAASSDIADAIANAPPATSSTDVEYEYGHRVEQVIAAPGSIARISVGVVVQGDLSAEKQQRITDLVSMAAGVNAQRGDAIVVQTLNQLGAQRMAVSGPEGPEFASPAVEAEADESTSEPRSQTGANRFTLPLVAVLVLVAVIAALMMRSARISRAPARLSVQERQRVLLEVQRALGDGAAVGPGAKP